MGLILLARFCPDPSFPESGDPDSLDLVGGLIEDGLEDEVEADPVSFFFTDRSSGMSWTGVGLTPCVSSSMSDSFPTSISSSSEQTSLLIREPWTVVGTETRDPWAPGPCVGPGKTSVNAALNI